MTMLIIRRFAQLHVEGITLSESSDPSNVEVSMMIKSLSLPSFVYIFSFMMKKQLLRTSVNFALRQDTNTTNLFNFSIHQADSTVRELGVIQVYVSTKLATLVQMFNPGPISLISPMGSRSAALKHETISIRTTCLGFDAALVDRTIATSLALVGWRLNENKDEKLDEIFAALSTIEKI